MGRSISPMRGVLVAGSDPIAAPRLIVPMSLRLVIPRRVALQQSSPPLHQPSVILKGEEAIRKGKTIKQQVCQFQIVSTEGFTPFGCAQICAHSVPKQAQITPNKPQ